MRGERLMLLRLVLDGDEDIGLGIPGLKARATEGGHSALGSSPPQKPSTGCDSAYRQRNSRSKSSTMQPLSCRTMLVWAWLQSQVKLEAEGRGQEANCRTLGLGRCHNQKIIPRQLYHHEGQVRGRPLSPESVQVLASLVDLDTWFSISGP